MTFQPTPMLSSSTVEMGSESSDRGLAGLTPDESAKSNAPGDLPSEKKGYKETVTSPIALTLGGDDYPDGGLAAWCVVLGVSRFNHSLALSNSSLMHVRPCSVRVLFSRRRLHLTSSVSNSRLTSEDSFRFGLASAWGVRAIQILPLVGVATYP